MLLRVVEMAIQDAQGHGVVELRVVEHLGGVKVLVLLLQLLSPFFEELISDLHQLAVVSIVLLDDVVD